MYRIVCHYVHYYKILMRKIKYYFIYNVTFLLATKGQLCNIFNIGYILELWIYLLSLGAY